MTPRSAGEDVFRVPTEARRAPPAGVPGTYRALVCRAIADDLSGTAIETLPSRGPGPGEVLVYVRAAALNFPDLLTTQGKYQYKPELPYIPGMEAAGIVAAVGDGVTRVSTGDRVVIKPRTGAFAEQVVLPESQVRPIPGDLDFATAASYQAAAITAYVALVRCGHLQSGETLLVHGASGGVGVAAVQLGKHLGARVIATGTSDEKLEVVRSLGADEVINLTRENLRDRVKALTADRGADVIYDPVGGDVFDASVRCIAWGGRLLVIGFTSGRIPTIGVNMPLIKGFSVVGVRAGEYGRRNPVLGAENQRAIDELTAQGVFRPHLCARLPIERALDGLRMIADRKVVGKIVLEMDQGAV
ncbi:MAG: hypothetical protein RIS35_2509 [Pseudomonadota bacterium]|jgi:NADPH2:quinone reductase